MCGIIGYVGREEAVPRLLSGLERLEYRGYDSAGVVVVSDGSLRVEKGAGRLERLVGRLADHGTLSGRAGAGHTRWATHGVPNDTNAHPHLDCSGRFAVVHNGILENHEELRSWLRQRGHHFRSETDTEVLPHLVEEAYRGDLVAAVREALRRVQGSYAVVVLSSHHPNELVAARRHCPLILGLGADGHYAASDIPALLPFTREVLVLEEEEVAHLTPERVAVTDLEGQPVLRPSFRVEWDASLAERGGFPHFMLKEIYEQPRVFRETLAGRVDPDRVRVVAESLGGAASLLARVERVVIVACGTAAHAGEVGRRWFEGLARLPAWVDLASEFRYRDLLLGPATLTLAISQSGETADTLAAVREAKRHGSPVLAITNVVGSSITREADFTLYTRAGPEVAVASTKTYLAQLLCLALLALYGGRARGTLPEGEGARLLRDLISLPGRLEEVLATEEEVRQAAATVAAGAQPLFFVGRGLDHAVALEGALKVKEISYIHAEAYAAGELKHGPLALVEPGVPAVAVATQRPLLEKLAANVKEIQARGGVVLGVTRRDVPGGLFDRALRLPEAADPWMPFLAVVPLQLLAYHAARARGCDVDRPRNLAKSVTVE